MIQAVVFDLGEVLSSPATLFSEPASRLGVPADAYERLYWEGRLAYDLGGSDRDYWGPILRGLDKPDALETIQQLARLDADLWLGIRPAAWQLLRDVRSSGRASAVLTNAPSALDRALVDAPFVDDADYWFVSASMGVGKPDPEAFSRVTEVLEVHPSEIAFIDDKQHNVAAAAEFGWASHLFSDDADTRAWLESIGVL